MDDPLLLISILIWKRTRGHFRDNRQSPSPPRRFFKISTLSFLIPLEQAGGHQFWHLWSISQNGYPYSKSKMVIHLKRTNNTLDHLFNSGLQLLSGLRVQDRACPSISISSGMILKLFPIDLPSVILHYPWINISAHNGVNLCDRWAAAKIGSSKHVGKQHVLPSQLIL